MSGGVRLGETFAGYRVESLLGRGGMSVVYVAEDLNLGRKVTLKILAPELAGDPTFRTRFINESRIAAALDHPNVVPIYEADEAEGHLFIAMRYVRGTDLDVLIREEGPLSLARAAEIVRQIAAALDAAHREGLVHRDVKPANILIAPAGGPDQDHAYLTDFGITKRPAQGPITTRTGEIMGTVDYVAPEQVEGKAVDFRADVYSLGCVAYQALTAHVPFERESDLAVLWAHVHERPPKATAQIPQLPAGVDAVLGRAMAKDPKDRFESCGAFAGALRDRTEGVVRAPGPTRLPRARRPLARKGRLAAALALAFLVIVAAAAAILLGKGSPASCPKVSGGSLRLERIDPESLFVRQSIPAPPFATAIAVDHQGVWAATPAGISVTCVAQEQTGGQVDLPFTPSQVAMGYNGLWVAGSMAHGAAGSPGRVTRVVHPTGPVDSPSRVRDTPIAVTLGASAVWVLGSHGTLTRLAKPAGSGSGEPSVPKGVSVGAGASDVVVDEDRPSGPVVWVVNDRTRTLRPVRPHPLHVGKTTPLPGGADAVTVTPGRVWFLDEGRSRLTSVDDTTGEPEGPPITVGNSPTDVAAADQALWVANGGSLWRIDPVTEDVRKRPLDGRVLSLAVEPPIPTRHQAIWVLVRRPTAS